MLQQQNYQTPRAGIFSFFFSCTPSGTPCVDPAGALAASRHIDVSGPRLLESLLCCGLKILSSPSPLPPLRHPSSCLGVFIVL